MENKNYKIVMVDDEKELREICAEILKSQGYQIDQYADASEALERLQFPVDLLITDVSLPGMTGIEMAKNFYFDLIQKGKPIVPVLFVSGQIHDNLKIPGAGSDDIFQLTKPFNMANIVGMVGQILSSRKPTSKAS